MGNRLFDPRPLVSLPQLVVFIMVAVALLVAIDINRRNQIGRAMGGDQATLQAQVDVEQTRQVLLNATLEYVQSDDYVADYARNEAGYILPGERRVVPLIVSEAVIETPTPTPQSDPLENASPWQAWWQLVSDAPPPSSQDR